MTTPVKSSNVITTIQLRDTGQPWTVEEMVDADSKFVVLVQDASRNIGIVGTYEQVIEMIDAVRNALVTTPLIREAVGRHGKN